MLDTKQYNQVERAFHPCVIVEIGHNRTWLTALRYGTYQHSRLQMKSLEVEALILTSNYTLNTISDSLLECITNNIFIYISTDGAREKK